MKTLTKIALIFALLSVLFFALRAFSPESVDQDGTLHEYFFLVVLAWFCAFAAILTALASVIYGVISSATSKKKQNPDTPSKR